MSVPTEHLDWRRSSRCTSGTCVEVARQGDAIRVRDSKSPEVVLSFSREEWAAFVEAAAAGEFRF
jgi:hypothetical protein